MRRTTKHRRIRHFEHLRRDIGVLCYATLLAAAGALLLTCGPHKKKPVAAPAPTEPSPIATTEEPMTTATPDNEPSPTPPVSPQDPPDGPLDPPGIPDAPSPRRPMIDTNLHDS